MRSRNSVRSGKYKIKVQPPTLWANSAGVGYLRRKGKASIQRSPNPLRYSSKGVARPGVLTHPQGPHEVNHAASSIPVLSPENGFGKVIAGNKE